MTASSAWPCAAARPALAAVCMPTLRTVSDDIPDSAQAAPCLRGHQDIGGDPCEDISSAISRVQDIAKDTRMLRRTPGAMLARIFKDVGQDGSPQDRNNGAPMQGQSVGLWGLDSTGAFSSMPLGVALASAPLPFRSRPLPLTGRAQIPTASCRRGIPRKKKKGFKLLAHFAC